MAAGYSHAPSKVQKSIHKRKGASSQALHANSRDARRLNRAHQRDEKLARASVLRARANEKYLSRISFFRDAAQNLLESSDSNQSLSSTTADSNPPSDPQAAAAEASQATSPFTHQTLARLIQAYLARETPQTSSQPQRKNRPVQLTAQESALRAALQDDIEEARTGFWMPDLCHGETLKFLLETWDGGWSSLGNLKFVRVRFEGAIAAVKRGESEKDGEDERLEVRVTQSAFPPRAS